MRTQIFYSFVAGMKYSTSYGAAEGRNKDAVCMAYIFL